MREAPTTLLSRSEINRRALATDHLMSTLGRRAASGGLIAVAGQVAQMSIALATMVVMARLLTPADFGLVAMAATVTVFVGLFRDLGLSAATVQRKDLDQDTVSALFYVNLAMGVIIMIAAFAVAPIAAWSFGDDRVFWLVVALAIPIPLAAAAAQHKALLQRGMRWMAMQWTTLAAQLAGAIAAVLIAWKTDFGYWSLVVQVWVSVILGLSLAWVVCPWRPGRVKSWEGTRSALGFGLNLTGFNFLNYFHRQFDNVLIGWRWGPTELGYYTRAYGLFLMPLTAVTWPLSTAVVPAMSRLQSDPERWKRLYLTSVASIAVITSLISGLLFVLAEPIVLGLLGPQWQPSVLIFQVLAISMIIQPIYSSGGWIYISLARTDRLMRAAIFAAIWYCAAFLVGVQFGAVGVAIAYCIAIAILAPVWLWWAMRDTALTLSDLAIAVFPPTLCIVVAVTICSTIPRLAAGPSLDLILRAIAVSAVYIIGLSAAALINPGWISNFQPLHRLIKQYMGLMRASLAARGSR